MHLQISPDAPFLIRAAAASVLVLHIGGGSVAVAAGGAALAFRKGGRLHRLAGDVFVVAMLTALGIGAVVAPLLHQAANTFGGIFGIYLVVSGWATMRRQGDSSRLDRAILVIPVAAAVAMTIYGWIGAHSPRGVIDGAPYQAAYIAAALGVLTAILDLRVILRRSLSATQRLARHLWRMCAALFLASGSLFLGQQQVFPQALRGSPILWILALAPLALMIFWLIRVQRTSAPKSPTLRPATPRAATPEAI